MLLPVTERGAAIAHAWADQAVVGVLLKRMRDPSGGAADGKNGGGHRARKAEHADAYGEIEVEVGPQPIALGYAALYPLRGLEQAAAAMLGDGLRDLPQQRGARIAVGINRVTKAGRQAMIAGKSAQAFVNPRAGLEFGEHCLDPIAGTAVNRSAERAQCREHRGEEVGAGARDHAGGKG